MNNTILTDNKEIETLDLPLMVERRLSLRGNLAQDRVQGAPSVVRG